MKLHKAGKVTNHKGVYDGVSVTTFAGGTRELYDWLDGNTDVRFLPVELVNSPELISKNRKMVSIHDEFKPCSWYRDHWTEDRVIMRSGPGEFERELGKTIKVDTSYGSIPKGAIPEGVGK